MKNSTKIIIAVLALITAVAVGVSIWALFFRNTKETVPQTNVSSEAVLAPDYAPQQIESNAEPLGDENDDKLKAEEGGGAVSLSYSKNVTIDISDKTASLMFANPSKSIQNMVVQIAIKDNVIVQSGLLLPGNKVTSLALDDESVKKLSKGGYEGKFVVLYYDKDSGEKAVVNTEIPLKITVNE